MPLWPRVRNPPDGWHLSPPTGGPEAGCLPPGEASWPQRDARDPGGPSLARRGSRGCEYAVLPPKTPGRKLSDERTDRPRQPSTPSGALWGTIPPRGAAGRKAQTHRGGGGSSSVSVGRPGAGGYTTPAPTGCLLRAPRSRGWGLRGISVEAARGRRARSPLLGPGWGRRKRGRWAPACRREGPREAEGGAGPERPPAPRGTAHQSTLSAKPGRPLHPEARGAEPQLQRADTHSVWSAGGGVRAGGAGPHEVG